MDVNRDQVPILSEHLLKTLSPEPSVRKASENYLHSIEKEKNYPLLLLQIIQSPLLNNSGTTNEDATTSVKISAAINFKNYIKRNWSCGVDDEDLIHSDDRIAIKTFILDLMLTCPEAMQVQLGEAIAIIGKRDFPDKWPDLIPQMVNKFASGDFTSINGVLRTAHSLFKKYRHETKSDKLWSEIKLVLTTFADPLTRLFNTVMESLQQLLSSSGGNSNIGGTLKPLLNCIVLITKIFYSLNAQDLPEFFEDNMSVWMNHFQVLLKLDPNSLIALGIVNNDEAGPVELIKSQICDNIGMYAHKYDEEFQTFLPGFVSDVWQVLLTTGLQPKYDLLVSNAIEFLANVASKVTYKSLFEAPEVLQKICEKVILPNIHFGDVDRELFEDNAEEYIRRDIEGSDVDTRRRASCDLVKALCKSFEGPVIANFSQYVEHLLMEYTNNAAGNWQGKDAALFLVISLASRAQTRRHGVTQVTELVNLNEFFASQILPELQSPLTNPGVTSAQYCLVRADCLKYVMTFRNQLAKPALLATLPTITVALTSHNPVLHSYAAVTLEKLLLDKLLVREEIGNTHELFAALIACLDMQSSEENEYVIKAILQLSLTMQDGMLPSLELLVTKLRQKLVAVVKNPSKPNFNHYMFECFALWISIFCETNVEYTNIFENLLYPVIEEILKQEVVEFFPYSFQLLALLLENKAPNLPLSPSYASLLEILLQPTLWDCHSYIPALVRFLQAYVMKASNEMAGNPRHLNRLLGIYKKLVDSKSHDTFGLQLLATIMRYFPCSQLEGSLTEIFKVLFLRLHKQKTTKFIKALLVFFSYFMIVKSPMQLITLIDHIQSRMFGMVIERLYILDLQKVSGDKERRICVLGLTRLLAEARNTPMLVDITAGGGYLHMWCPLLQAVISLLELPRDTTPSIGAFTNTTTNTNSHSGGMWSVAVQNGTGPDVGASSGGYEVTYNKLQHAKAPVDPIDMNSDEPSKAAQQLLLTSNSNMDDLKLNLARGIATLSQQCPAGQIRSMITQGLHGDALQLFNTYCVMAGVTLL